MKFWVRDKDGSFDSVSSAIPHHRPKHATLDIGPKWSVEKSYKKILFMKQTTEIVDIKWKIWNFSKVWTYGQYQKLYWNWIIFCNNFKTNWIEEILINNLKIVAEWKLTYLLLLLLSWVKLSVELSFWVFDRVWEWVSVWDSNFLVIWRVRCQQQTTLLLIVTVNILNRTVPLTHSDKESFNQW